VGKIIQFPLNRNFSEARKEFQLLNDEKLIEYGELLDKEFKKNFELNLNIYKIFSNAEPMKNFPEEEIMEFYNVSAEEFKFIRVLLNYDQNIYSRILQLFLSANNLISQKDWLTGLMITRSLIETCWLDIYLSYKGYEYLKNDDFDNFFKLFSKVNFYSSSGSTKKEYIPNDDPLLKNLRMADEKGFNTITLGEYYEKTDFIKIISDFEQADFMKGSDKDYPFQKFVLEKLKNNYKFDIHAYKALCDITHPNAIYFSNPNDPKNILDYKFIYLMAFNEELITLVKFNGEIKDWILEKIIKNKKDFIKFFI
jgi:hypothetical protein